MARRKRQTVFSGGLTFASLDGFDEIMRRLSLADANVRKLGFELAHTIDPYAKYELTAFMDLHRDGASTPPTQVTPPRGRDITIKTLKSKTNVQDSGNYIRHQVGFDVKDTTNTQRPIGGYPALFLDVGTKDNATGKQLIQPTYFVYYASQRIFKDAKHEQALIVDRWAKKYLPDYKSKVTWHD